MATSLHFSQKVKSEQNLYEDIVIESLKIYGQDVYYLPRTLVNENTILGEDIPSKFGSAYKIEMYIENIDGFDGEGDLFTRFGVEIRDAATFVVSRRRFKMVVNQLGYEVDLMRPAEGDLIYLALTNKLFQIMHVEHEQPFYQLSNLPVFKLRCELFEYSEEDFDTGIQGIDRVERNAYKTSLLLNNVNDSARSIFPQFFIGEEVIQRRSDGITMRGEVLRYNPETDILDLIHVGADSGDYAVFHITNSGDPDSFYSTWLINDRVETPYVGINQSDSDVRRRILAIGDSISGGTVQSQNDTFDTTSNAMNVLNFLDFTEKNPFGDAEDV